MTKQIIVLITYLSSLTAFWLWMFGFGNIFAGMAIFWTISTILINYWGELQNDV